MKKIQIHPSAVVAESVQLGEGVIIGPNCVIESDASIGTRTELRANVFIGQSVKIGQDNKLFPNCTLGCWPQVLSLNADSKIGGLSIGDNNTIREYVTIHPSIHPNKLTKVGNDNLLMVGVHIGHDCTIENNVVMSNFVQISGHCKIETGAWLSGMVVLHQFVTIGKWSYAAGLAGINHDIPPFLIVSGHYPPEIRGVNKRGMQRAGLSEQSQKQILQAYRKLYRKEGTLLENAKALSQEGALDENAKSIVDTILKSSEHRFGRYLELFRE